MKVFLAITVVVLSALLALWHQPIVLAHEDVIVTFQPWESVVLESFPNQDCPLRKWYAWQEPCAQALVQRVSFKSECRVIHCTAKEEFEGDPDDDLIKCERGRACIPEGAYELLVCATRKDGKKHCETMK